MIKLKNILNESPKFVSMKKLSFDDIKLGSKISNKFRSGRTYIVMSVDNKSATVKNLTTGNTMTLYSLANYELVKK